MLLSWPVCPTWMPIRSASGSYLPAISSSALAINHESLQRLQISRSRAVRSANIPSISHRSRCRQLSVADPAVLHIAVSNRSTSTLARLMLRSAAQLLIRYPNQQSISSHGQPSFHFACSVTYQSTSSLPCQTVTATTLPSLAARYNSVYQHSSYSQPSSYFAGTFQLYQISERYNSVHQHSIPYNLHTTYNSASF